MNNGGEDPIGEASSEQPQQQSQTNQQHVILFYRYHPLSPDWHVTEIYRQALQTLCHTLSLQGRILVGCSRTEGINGTLASRNATDVLAFTYALLGTSLIVNDNERRAICNAEQQNAVKEFWQQSKDFFATIREPELRMSSPNDFKWSRSESDPSLFPDLNVKLVSELIGTGGALADIPLEETARGYLEPQQWRDALAKVGKEAENFNDTNDTILIDCRNTKEYEIGHFTGAVDPQTTTFAQFPKWVIDHEHLLAHKKVLMYCTGGIRCGKASAFIRRTIPSVQSVHHLKGGIHKYLEVYGAQDDDVDDITGGVWKGRNFVFDGRGAASPQQTRMGRMVDDKGSDQIDGGLCVAATEITDVIPSSTNKSGGSHIVGRCVNCHAPFDDFDPHCVCTVCREPTLVCPACQDALIEYHCRQHAHLKHCYFSNLQVFSRKQLQNQLFELEALYKVIEIGRRFRQKRRTLEKQCDRITTRLQQIHSDIDGGEAGNAMATIIPLAEANCRNCGGFGCDGRCWGFFGLRRKQRLQEQQQNDESAQSKRPVSNENKAQRCGKAIRVVRDSSATSGGQMIISHPPNMYRDAETSIRVPPCTTRILQCHMKGKWFGQSVSKVVQHEFIELRRPEVLQSLLKHGLLLVNDDPISAYQIAEYRVKNGDRIGRILHWHEAPVLVPSYIPVQRRTLPLAVLAEYKIGADQDPAIYICNKPWSVPVHPAGPYLANSLTSMVEGQEKLLAKSLKPVHRTDRVTSGLTLCCVSSSVSNIFHKCLSEGTVEKLYLAKVKGEFPDSFESLETLEPSNYGSIEWLSKRAAIRVDAPIDTPDPTDGIRIVSSKGKTSISLFRRIAFNSSANWSLVACCPVTGRNHQLRVHLQWLGFPIVNDVQYGGPMDGSMTVSPPDAIVNAMTKAALLPDETVTNDAIRSSHIEAAKRACCICRDTPQHGILQSFTAAQLLEKGHAICLHAYRYRIRVHSKKRNANCSLPIAVLTYEVEPPDWASPRDLEGVDWI